MKAFEVNFDGLVGPSHNYSGLSTGNVASEKHANETAKPRNAALQGLHKMKQLHDLGLKQGIIAPQERPNLHVLRRLGFQGNDKKIIASAFRSDPRLFFHVCSASSMWTANACTMSPSSDSQDGKAHFTVANLSSKFHRSIEWPTTARILKAIFSDDDTFEHHSALPSVTHFGDEGAANHTRLCSNYADAGIQLFVYGKSAFHNDTPVPKHYPARQTLEACQAVARYHQLDSDNTYFLQQNPDVIDAGVFHNDVIAVGNQNVLLYHEKAFLNGDATIAQIKSHFESQGQAFFAINVPNQSVSVSEAVANYLFNSQLITLPDATMALIAPRQVENDSQTWEFLQNILTGDNPIQKIIPLKLNQSMKNGGGPACLRQRVVLNEEEIAQVNPQCLLTDSLYEELVTWVKKHYREELKPDDMIDPEFLIECRTALDELTQMLDLGSVYQFQTI
ncbi:MAG: N-succinylarginine dihydrolase [Pseudomonadota bacterium]